MRTMRESLRPFSLPASILFQIILVVQAQNFHHAAANNNLTGIEHGGGSDSGMSGLVHRLVTKGPEGMELMDIVFLGCVVILGLEFVNFLVKKSGCKSLIFYIVYLFLCWGQNLSFYILDFESIKCQMFLGLKLFLSVGNT